jgi:ribosomal protein L2
MPSGEKKSFKASTLVSVGQVSNVNHQLEVYGKAGTRRRLG